MIQYGQMILNCPSLQLVNAQSPRRQPPSSLSSYQSDALSQFLGQSNAVDLQGIASGQIPGVAPIPVPGYPGPQDVPTIPGVNTIPGLNNFNYLVGQLIPQVSKRLRHTVVSVLWLVDA